MRQQGVTLIQMMFALGVAGLLTQLSVTAYKAMSDDLHQANVARSLALALREARNQATLRHQATLVRPLRGDWGQGWRISLEDGEQLLREYRPARPVRIIASSRRVVRFSARGAPLGAGFGAVTLFICERNPPLSQHRVVLSSSGRVSLRSTQTNGCAGR
ncbi:type IV pili biogenesis protein FimT [Pseudomonas mosselii]|uniref:Type II secretion system protein H n=2 Tax=Pseudomonas mosselii TaxID=78327 RepID=A0A5R8Z2C6_9PSED|nr:GspH/FimT family pseudopilin [Pseudomonas mosselii]TLP59972.1 type IV pili biogenesis protein FimT [Pseudomonas mosselii]